jgi:very-short-patch-repair endonuclease
MTGVGRKVCVQRAELGPASVDRETARLAARQHGVVSRAQLREAGLSDAAITRRSEAGRLHVVHRGVYSVGHTVLGRHGRWMAAVLAGGPGAVLSHASAAALWEIRPSAAVVIDVTTRRTGRKRAGLRIHGPRALPPGEVTVRDGIPVTTAARTLLDRAAVLQRRALERALDEAEIRELTDYPALDALARAHPGYRGASRLRATLQARRAGTTATKTELEERFLKLCRAHGLPTPLVNTWVEFKEVDFLFEDARLIVETDSWAYHRTRHAFESDRARDALLARAGYRTLRFTDRQLTQTPQAVADAIAAVLADRRAA